MDNKPHIIQKVQAELTVTSNDRHREQSERLRHAIQDAIQNLEPILDGLAEESLYRIDSLSIEITLSNADLDQLEKKIEKAIRDEIHEVFKSQPANTESISKELVEQMSEVKSHREVLSAFLKTGRLPWWADNSALDDAEQWLLDLAVDEWIEFINPLAAENPLVIDRLMRQMSRLVVQELFKKTATNHPDGAQLIKLQQEILQFLQNRKELEAEIYEVQRDLIIRIIRGSAGNLDLKKMTDNLLLSVFQILRKTEGEDLDIQLLVRKLEQWFQNSGQPDTEYWISRLNQLSDREFWTKTSDEADPKLLKTDSESEFIESDRDEIREGIRVENAGVVILHPFLDSLFKNLGYVENGEFLNEAANERAVCLVYYLATGDEEFPEYELLLPKFLCGWPMETPVNRFLKITNTEIEECESVLSSCIQNWEVLKNTSIDGLRNNFLQREGILKREEFGWSLYIEQQTIDLLLEKLPWNLSIIKLKWMDEMLIVHRH